MIGHRHSIPEVEEIALRSWAKYWSRFLINLQNPTETKAAWSIRRRMRAIYFTAYVRGYTDSGFDSFKSSVEEAIEDLHKCNEYLEKELKKHKNRKKQ